jgi:hypothetical protein
MRTAKEKACISCSPDNEIPRLYLCPGRINYFYSMQACADPSSKSKRFLHGQLRRVGNLVLALPSHGLHDGGVAAVGGHVSPRFLEVGAISDVIAVFGVYRNNRTT